MSTIIDRRTLKPYRHITASPSYLKDEPLPTPAEWHPTKPIQLSRLGVYLAALAFSLSFLYGFCLYVIGPLLHKVVARLF